MIGAILNLVTLDVAGIEDSVACSHMAAVHFYTDSIEPKNCSYTAYPCKSLKDFTQGNCIDCSVNGCNKMGHWASKSKDQGSLYFSTQDATRLPYCYSHYRVKAMSNRLSGMGQTKGKFTVSLRGALRTSRLFLLDNSETVLSVGSSIQKIAESDSDIGSLQGATLTFQKAPCFLTCWSLDDKWSFKSLEITDGQSQKLIRMCPTKDFVTSGGSIDFNLC